MKTPSTPQSATSLPRAPRDDERARFVKYMVMMAIRVTCFALMVLVTPYSWYTWVFGAGAVFLPYLAVVVANVGQDALPARAESPDMTLPGDASAPQAPPAEAPSVIRVAENPRPDVTGPRDGKTP